MYKLMVLWEGNKENIYAHVITAHSWCVFLWIEPCSPKIEELKQDQYALELASLQPQRVHACKPKENWNVLVTFTCRPILHFSITGQSRQKSVLNANADVFIPRFKATGSRFESAERFGKLERGYVLYFISIVYLGCLSFMWTKWDIVLQGCEHVNQTKRIFLPPCVRF